MSAKKGLGISVLSAAKERIAWTFDTFPRACVSFSGGKDSTVMLHLVAEEARARGRKFALFFLDWEAQYKLTINHVAEMFATYRDVIDP
jgi:predicted phosphoadenosine phosphosulfate sulfurtransferase